MTDDEINDESIKLWIHAAKEANFFETNLDNENVKKFYRLLYPVSFCKYEDRIFLMAKTAHKPMLVIIGRNLQSFQGSLYTENDFTITLCPLNHRNASELRKLFPHTRPSTIGKKGLSFGVGDRLGIASPGHIRIFKKYDVIPVLAQQSLRELILTGRDFQNLVDTATWAVFQEGYYQPWGADGDHLKTVEAIKSAISAGCSMITADLSDYIHNQYYDFNEEEILEEYSRLDEKIRQKLEKKYLSYTVNLNSNKKISFSKCEIARIFLIYSDAMQHAKTLYEAGRQVKENYDFEISIDETAIPTSPQAHVYVVEELRERNIPFISIAPRFVGEFQKGIDYIGSTLRFEESFQLHAAIARYYGYKISIHSGSDKFTVYPTIGRHTRGCIHIKTSGTNWLQALLLIAEIEPELFRKIHVKAEEMLSSAREYYSITPNLSKTTDINDLDDERLKEVFENPNNKQILHVTYGEIFKDDELKLQVYKVLWKNIEIYWSHLESHIKKHIETLGLKQTHSKPLSSVSSLRDNDD